MQQRRSFLACLICAACLVILAGRGYCEPAAPSPEKLFDAGQFSQARDAYQALLKQNPDRPDFHIGLIRTLLRLDDWQDAVAAGNQAMQNCPDNAEIDGLCAIANIRAGQMDTAQSLSDKALKLGLNSYWANVAAGDMALWNDQQATALSYFDQAAKIDPQEPDAWLGISKIDDDVNSPDIANLDDAQRRALKAYVELAPRGYPHNRILPAARLDAGPDFQRFIKLRLAHPSLIVEPLTPEQWKALDRGDGVFTTTVPFKVVNGQIWIPAKINDHLFQLAFDTGSTGIRLSDKAVSLLKLKPLARSQVGAIVGNVNEEVYIADSMSLGSLVIKPQAVEGISIPSARSGGDGIFGVSLLDRFVLTLDFKKKVLILARGRDVAAPYPIPDNIRVTIPFHYYSHDIIAPVSVDPVLIWNSAPVWGILDTGSLDNILSLPLAQKLAAKLAPSDIDKGTATNIAGIGGKIKKVDWLAIGQNLYFSIGSADNNLNELESGGNGVSIINEVLSPEEEMEIGAILGEPYAERCSRVTFDYRRQLLTFDWPVAPQTQNNQSDNQASSSTQSQTQQSN